MAGSLHPAAPHDLPSFIAAPNENDVLMVAAAAVLTLAVIGFGVLFLRLHTLPERIAHRGHKLQFEIVAVLGLIALFTHMHIFWIAALLLALIDLPDFGTSLNRIAGSTEKIAAMQRLEGVAVQSAPRSGPDVTGKGPDHAVRTATDGEQMNRAATPQTTQDVIGHGGSPHA